MSTTRLLVLGAVRIFQPVHGYFLRRELMTWRADQCGAESGLVRSLFLGDIGNSAVLWGLFAAVALVGAGLPVGTRTFQRESS